MNLPVAIPRGWEDLFADLADTSLEDLYYALSVIELAADELSDWFPEDFAAACPTLAASVRAQITALERDKTPKLSKLNNVPMDLLADYPERAALAI